MFKGLHVINSMMWPWEIAQGQGMHQSVHTLYIGVLVTVTRPGGSRSLSPIERHNRDQIYCMCLKFYSADAGHTRYSANSNSHYYCEPPLVILGMLSLALPVL